MANNVATTKQNEVSSELKTAAAKVTEFYIHDVANLNEAVGVPLTEESKRCASNVIISLCGELGAVGVQALPREQLIKVLQFVTINALDVFGGQVFIDKRKDRDGKVVSITATPMGNAYEIMTARFGVGVAKIHPARIVHEGDEFELPQFDGLESTNIKHKTTLAGLDGKAIAVYYIIEKDDGRLEYAIATREGVAKNLMAQILNATLRVNVDRNELMKKMEGMTLDELLADPTLSAYISPAYRSPATRESMIVTKMKKNALLHYTRDLGVKHSMAFEKVNASVSEDSDMVVSTQDGNGESANQPAATKIADFAVEDDGSTEEANEKPEAHEESRAPEEAPAEQPAAQEPAQEAEAEKAPKQEQLGIFDL